MSSKTTSIVTHTPGIWCPVHLDAKKICKRTSVYKSTHHLFLDIEKFNSSTKETNFINKLNKYI